jgi:hypothetical protein
LAETGGAPAEGQRMARSWVNDPGIRQWIAAEWGFAEVSRVEAFESSAGCGLAFKWEGARRLDLEFNDYILLSPEGHPL